MRISDWSSDVCSSDLKAPSSGASRHLLPQAGEGLKSSKRKLALGLGLSLEQPEQHDPHRPAHDGRIGDVERRPVVVAPVPLDEVDHVAGDHAVDDVADRAADQQRDRQDRKRALLGKTVSVGVELEGALSTKKNTIK